MFTGWLRMRSGGELFFRACNKTVHRASHRQAAINRPAIQIIMNTREKTGCGVKPLFFAFVASLEGCSILGGTAAGIFIESNE
jgi:hypothetical protein